MEDKILLVDDEPNVLEGLQRLLNDGFSVETANGGAAGLSVLAASGPFAVVVSDMRMPGMNGVEFLTAVRERSPETVRLMLTGNADMQTAIDAVNEGCVFRFLTKPCPKEVLHSALGAALRQHALITAEKDLLEKTLMESVKVLTEILALVSPAAFSRSLRIHRIMQHMVRPFGLRDAWRYEIAAMLSQVGCVAFDSETVAAMYAGGEVPDAVRERFKSHPSIAFELLSRIPRLELVASMIAGQQGLPSGKPSEQPTATIEPVELGAYLLKIAVDFDELVLRGAPAVRAIEKLKGRPDGYYLAALAALESLPVEAVALVSQEISLRELTTGMFLEEDLRLPSGMLMMARNQEITSPVLVRIRTVFEKTPVTKKIKVKVPQRVVPPDLKMKDQTVLQPSR